MTDAAVPIDIESLAIRFLSDHARVKDMADDRIATKNPTDFPDGYRLRVTLIGQRVSPQHGWLQVARLQVDAYSGTADDEPAAHELAARATGALLRMNDATFDRAVVTATDVLAMQANPDLETGVSGYRFDVIIHAHPKPS